MLRRPACPSLSSARFSRARQVSSTPAHPSTPQSSNPPGAQRPARPAKVDRAVARQLLQRTPAELQLATRFFSWHGAFLGSASKLQDLTFLSRDEEGDALLPEVAFCGRSNVGKSTLLNAILGKRVAKVSNTPGATQTLNFFDVRHQLCVIDMPGYGYARAPKTLVADWTQTVCDFLVRRNSLRRTFVLVDSRIGAQALDREMMAFLQHHGTAFQVVLTKIDKISQTQLSTRLVDTEKLVERHPIAFPLVLPVSAVKNVGIQELQSSILGACNITEVRAVSMEEPPRQALRQVSSQQSDRVVKK